MLLVVSEIVASLQGEGKYTGYPTTFIRMFGCNLNCPYCDTKYALKGKKVRKSIDTVLGETFKLQNHHVCITGGEPLLQESVYCLVYDLVERGYQVSIETNGAVPIEEDTHRRFDYCMDIKCPSSMMEDRNVLSNLGKLLPQDEVKFVIYNYNDYLYARKVLKKHPTRAKLIFSPCFTNGKSNADQLSEWLLEDKIPNARLGVQVHKLIGIY